MGIMASGRVSIAGPFVMVCSAILPRSHILSSFCTKSSLWDVRKLILMLGKLL